jgi:hypothetical protein
MKVQNSEYAMTSDPVYHAHVDCPVGRLYRAKAELRGPRAREGRRYCEMCQRMDMNPMGTTERRRTPR